MASACTPPVKFVCKRFVDHAVALEPALPAECFRHDIKPEMGFAAGPVSGMALVRCGFILDIADFPA